MRHRIVATHPGFGEVVFTLDAESTRAAFAKFKNVVGGYVSQWRIVSNEPLVSVREFFRAEEEKQPEPSKRADTYQQPVESERAAPREQPENAKRAVVRERAKLIDDLDYPI